jgi:uncharacterized protein with GYD domain
MQKFIILMKLTTKGAGDFQGALQDIEATRTAVMAAHEIEDVCYVVTQGRADFVSVIGASSPELAGYYALELVKNGYVSTETLTGFDPAAFGEMVVIKGNKTKG